jgi:hypothetical protein
MLLPEDREPSHPDGPARDVDFDRDSLGLLDGALARQVGRAVADYTLLRDGSWPRPGDGSLPAAEYSARLVYLAADGSIADVTGTYVDGGSHQWGHETPAGSALRLRLPRPLAEGETLRAYLAEDRRASPDGVVYDAADDFREAAWEPDPSPGFVRLTAYLPDAPPPPAWPRVAVLTYAVNSAVEFNASIAPSLALSPGAVTVAGVPSPGATVPLNDLRRRTAPAANALYPEWQGTVAATLATIPKADRVRPIEILVPPGDYEETAWPTWLGQDLAIRAATPGTVRLRAASGARVMGWHTGMAAHAKRLVVEGVEVRFRFASTMPIDYAALIDCTVRGPGEATVAWNGGATTGARYHGRLALVRTELADIAEDAANGRRQGVFANNVRELAVLRCRFSRVGFPAADFSRRSDEGHAIYAQGSVGFTTVLGSAFYDGGGHCFMVRGYGAVADNLVYGFPLGGTVYEGSIYHCGYAQQCDLVGLDGVSNFAGRRGFGPALYDYPQNVVRRPGSIYRELTDVLILPPASTRGQTLAVWGADKRRRGVIVVGGVRSYFGGPLNGVATWGPDLPSGWRLPNGGVTVLTDAQAAGKPLQILNSGSLYADREAFWGAWADAPAPTTPGTWPLDNPPSPAAVTLAPLSPEPEPVPTAAEVRQWIREEIAAAIAALPPPPPGEPGPAGPPGPQGERGPAGLEGPPPSDAQVETAVRRVLTAAAAAVWASLLPPSS